MTPVRLGAVGYLNARPLVYGLEQSPLFELRFDVPSQCAALLHAGAIDVGLIPSAEYVRGEYRMVSGLAIASRGPVASVALYTTRAISDVRSISMDSSSRTSVALARLLCARLFGIQPAIEVRSPDLEAMLAHSDAALIIGDSALAIDHRDMPGGLEKQVEKIDLGEAWTRMTGLPFVYAFWAGRAGALDEEGLRALHAAREAGVQRSEEIARDYFSGAPALQAAGARYLRDNIRYDFGEEEQAGLLLFYRYAAELGILAEAGELRFY
jgi:chorismate dehydratase